MSIQTRPFGHPKARKFIKGSVIPFQSLLVKGDSLEESAALSLVAEALEGRGPLAKALKAEVKTVVDKFAKTNPEFAFTPFKRNRNSVAKKSNVEEQAPKKAPKKDYKESKKPAKTASKPKPKASAKVNSAEAVVA